MRVSPLENKGSSRLDKGPSKADLIEKLIGSETKAELLMFFHENPESTDTVEGIANRIRRNPKEIDRDVSDLVELGLLKEVRTVSFNKARDAELQREISKRLISPPSGDETERSSSREMTGIGIVDELLPEGYPSTSVVLVMGDPATGKTTLLTQLVVEALRKDKNVVYASLDDFPDSVRESMRMMGINPEKYEIE
ncbi:MAG TPA: ATPase domain-containing protein, partial [Dongiaceae bacterium]|nr:ATPase domain-containing protein [Dongiaceae bacterium]